ncbi:signal transduction histidine kinase [Streptomyces sp. 1114.5]|uniref:sensor histidine kinase n=1 Tax=Streptomyces sp. 1114.5 TaxID=1938830 RepID=UPI000EB4FF59|nr:ATP-binding protein [Streptomyces sp. 1114.5]RKT11563.1 signal transduction histidine kinase [Streptomyces sp. 1114.5]
MPGISAPRTGHRAGRSGSLRSSLLALVLVPSLGLAAAWGYAAYLLRDAGQRTALAAGTVVVAVVLLVSLIRGIRAARALSGRLSGLRADILSLAQQEIPDVVGRLRAGEPVPTPPAWAPSRRVGDEVQQTADGLAAVRQAAVAAIVHQAQGREGTKKVFLNIARRTQILIHRQISMLDALEREHEEPELLRELFAVDHLATRMRRNAENLVILGGALPARRWRNAVPMVNVLRSAVSETENYARVVVQGVPRASLSGQAVADVIHLIAELIENGTTFSPPYTQVQVSAQEVPKGLAVEVEDRGLGMTGEEYERLNEYLANPPELDVSALGDDLRLGLFVVARLAARHDIQVTLRPSPYGGTRAVVLVPSVLLEQPEQPAAVPGLPSGARVTRTPAPGARTPGGGGAPEVGGLGDVIGDVDGALSGALSGVLGGLLGTGPAGSAAPQTPPGEGAAAEGLLPDGGLLEDGGAPVGGGLSGGAPVDGAPVDGGLPEGGAVTPVNGGLPVGAQIPGLPGAVVVPRPSLPRPYDLPGDASPDGPVDGGLPEGSPLGAACSGPASGPVSGPAAEPAAVPFDGVPADRSAPTHERPQEDRVAHGPDGELRTPRILPQRVRNASLAEQLREAHAPGAMLLPSVGHPAATPTAPAGPAAPAAPRYGGADTDSDADDPSPQRSRATMAAIQRGTRTARAAGTEPGSTASPAAPNTPAAPSAAQEAKEQQ